jgi:acyl carrier protein
MSVTQVSDAGPTTGTERGLAEVLAEVTKVERVSVDRHFFEDLGADSMLMAQFCARVRKRPELPSVSMEDVYRHPTIRSLATALAGTTSNTVVSPAPASTEVSTPVSTAQYVLCGALQLLFYLGYAYLAALIIIQGYVWVSASSGVIDGYARSALFGGALFLGMCVLPIVVKWMLIGRWKPRSTTTRAADPAVSGAATRRRTAAATVYWARCPSSHGPARRARSPSLRMSACHGRIQAVLAHHPLRTSQAPWTTTMDARLSRPAYRADGRWRGCCPAGLESRYDRPDQPETEA